MSTSNEHAETLRLLIGRCGTQRQVKSLQAAILALERSEAVRDVLTVERWRAGHMALGKELVCDVLDKLELALDGPAEFAAEVRADVEALRTAGKV